MMGFKAGNLVDTGKTALSLSEQWWDLKLFIAPFNKKSWESLSEQWWDLKKEEAAEIMMRLGVLANNDGI